MGFGTQSFIDGLSVRVKRLKKRKNPQFKKIVIEFVIRNLSGWLTSNVKVKTGQRWFELTLIYHSHRIQSIYDFFFLILKNTY